MYKKIYEKITSFIDRYKYGEKILKIINSITTKIVYIIYPIFLLGLAYNSDIRFWKVFLIPGISLILLTIIRKYINAPRPYEKYDIDPIIKKDTKGKSFPSRHVFSIFVIAGTLYNISATIGMFLIFLGILLALVRVIGGVHFPKDVIFGALIGIVSSIIGWSITIF